jgi:hypothetical protein
MKTLTIVEKDRIGLLMDISYILGKEKINIESINVNVVGDMALITLQVKDPERVKEILKANGYHIVEEDVILVRLKDRPGELANLARLMAENGINVLNVYITAKGGGEAVVALKTDKQQKARRILKENGYNLQDEV